MRAESFWDALAEGDLESTYLAPHPGLTILWIGGLAQQLAADSTLLGKIEAVSLAVGVVGGMLILLCAGLVWRLLDRQRSTAGAMAALTVGLVLALDPLLILMTGMVGLDGTVSLLMLTAFLFIVLHFESRFPQSSRRL